MPSGNDSLDAGSGSPDKDFDSPDRGTDSANAGNKSPNADFANPDAGRVVRCLRCHAPNPEHGARALGCKVPNAGKHTAKQGSHAPHADGCNRYEKMTCGSAAAVPATQQQSQKTRETELCAGVNIEGFGVSCATKEKKGNGLYN